MADRALVTGATGFVGAAVVRALLAHGRPVRVLVRAGSDQRNLRGLEVERAEGDLNEAASLRAAMDGCRHAFHVAADYRLWVRVPEPMYRTNVQGSVSLLEAAAEASVERVVYTSSVATLGVRADGGAADETTPVSLDDMVGHYKRSKYLAEQAVRERAAALGLDVVTVNPSTPVGPGDVRPTPTGRVILEAAAGRMPAYVDTGLNIVHVDDVAHGHLLALERGRPGERYILGGRDLGLREILAVVARCRGRKPPRVRLPRWSVYPAAFVAEGLSRITGKEPLVSFDGLRMSKKLMYFSSGKAERELGYTWRPAEEAIADAVSWFERNGYL